MSATELAEAIGKIASGVGPYMRHEYYTQVIGAVRILAEALTGRQ